MKTTNELKANIGQTLDYPVNKLRFPVKVLDTRQMYGRTDLLISPVSGSGEQWVSAESCKQPETK